MVDRLGGQMKIKIGNYPNRLMFNLHSNYMNKKYGYVDWPTEQSKFENCLEWIDDRVQDFYNIFNRLWFDERQQKIKVHIDRWDTWSMDNTLAHIVVPMLIQLKETKHGAPLVDNADVPDRLQTNILDDFKYKEDGTTDKHFFARWDYVLDEMIFAFEQKCRDHWESDYYKYEDDPDAKFGFKLVWEDREGSKAHQERMSNGFRLFGKYYEALWD